MLFLTIVICIFCILIVVAFEAFAPFGAQQRRRERFTNANTIEFALASNKGDKRVVSMLESESLFLILKKKGASAKEAALPTFAGAGATVSYETEAERFVFLAVAQAHGLDADSFVLKNSALESTIRCAIISSGSGGGAKELQGQWEVVDYMKEIDKAIVNYFIPFARYRVVDFGPMGLGGLDPNDNFKETLILDELVYASKGGVCKRPDAATASPIIRDKNYFYRLFLPFAVEEFVGARGMGGPVTINIDKPLATRILGNKYDEFKVISVAPRIPLAGPGDVVILSNQEDAADNGKWIVTRVDGAAGATFLASMPLCDFAGNFEAVPTQRRDVLVGRRLESSSCGKDGVVWFRDLDVPGTVKGDTVVVHAVKPPSGEFECVGLLGAATKEVCESEYDGLGLPQAPGVWDRRCKVNTDCPFYDFKKRRGGCNDNGFCEMPLGVRRAGYTRYVGPGPGSHFGGAFEYELGLEHFLPDSTPFDETLARSPTYELSDADFYAAHFAGAGLEDDGFEWPDDLELVHVPPPHFFLNDACQALLEAANLDKASYTYVFGRCDAVWRGPDGARYFVETAAIHAPSKQKAKVVRFECKIKGDFWFKNIQVVGSIVQADLKEWI
jgi:hypothetical protein